MRIIFLLLLFLAVIFRTVGAAQAGVLGWTWLTLMTPQRLTWGFAADWQLNLVLAVVTIGVWLTSREPKRLQLNTATVVLFLFMAFITFTSFFALAPDLAWPRWNLAIKVMILGIVVSTIMTNQVRIHALVWVMVISLGYFGIKGGIFTLVTGGNYKVLPAEASFGDNNILALALCMILPLMNYLRLQSANRFVRTGTIGAMILTALAVVGTYSRGGLIGLFIMSAYLWWHSTNRTAIALILILIAFPVYKFMPEHWTERMGTIEAAGEDTSFQDRIGAWQTSFNIARARPLTGGGFNATESGKVYQKYGDDPAGRPRAAHSIYFEVLGDHGFVGLALYIGLLAVTWRYAGVTRRKARRDPKFEWIADLAAMIQVSLVTFLVAGAALSMAYYDMFYILLGITLVLRRMVVQHETHTPIPAAVGSNFGQPDRPALDETKICFKGLCARS